MTKLHKSVEINNIEYKGTLVFGIHQLGFINTGKTHDGVGQSLLIADDFDFSEFGECVARIESPLTQIENGIVTHATIVKLDLVKGTIAFPSEACLNGETDDFKWERPFRFKNLIIQDVEAAKKAKLID